jgi:pimeloyl-ACP methyl ester carboxylesterase
MRLRIGPLPVDWTRAESPRFRHPLLLLHGLWTGSWIWRRLAGYLAHRGWEAWAPSLLEAEPPVLEHAEALVHLERVARELPAPPIVVAHDAGVVAAMMLAAAIGAPAVVALAPLVAPADAGGGRGIFAWPQFWIAGRWAARVHPPWGAGGRAFLGAAGPLRDRLRPESGPIFRGLAASRIRVPPVLPVPGLIVAGERDAIAPAAAGERLGARFGWTRTVAAGTGHFVMLEPGWERLADATHRWIVQALGADLLLFLEDEET